MSTLNNSITGSLQLTLQGYRAMLERHFGLYDIEVVINDSQKEDSKRKSQENPKYPIAKLIVQELRAYKESANSQAIARHGWNAPNTNATISTIDKYFLFPVSVGTELVVTHSDPVKTMTLAEQMAIASLTNALNFKIELFPGISIMVRAEVPDTVSIPLAEADNTEYPGANSLSFQVGLYTWIGFAKDVNRASGTVAKELKTK